MENVDIIKRLDNIERYLLLASKEVLTLDEVAILTGLSKSYLYRLTSTHQIPYYKPTGKVIYFEKKEVEDWMKQGKVKSLLESEQQADNYRLRKEANNG
jgi:excisionase family DNA binding protein